jgi:D-glycero-alpha-D-manno-heptose 1-phosphate guanylyltransferase
MEVIILAGGLGTRLRSVLNDVPKCMAPLGEFNFLEILVDELLKYNFKKIIFAVGYKSEMIVDFISKKNYNVEMIFSLETIPLGTAGCIFNALKFSSENHIFVINGDTFQKRDYKKIFSDVMNYQANVNLITVNVTNDSSRYGSIILDDSCSNKIINFKEKKYNYNSIVSSGCYLFDSKLLKNISHYNFSSLENDLFEYLISENLLYAYPLVEKFIDIGIPEDYNFFKSYYLNYI